MATTKLALLLAIIASCACPTAVAPVSPAAPASDAAPADTLAERRLVVEIEGFAARACACSEPSCLEREHDALTAWADGKPELAASADASWHRADADARIEECRRQRPVPTDLDESLGGEPLDVPDDAGAAGAGSDSGAVPGSGG